MSARDRRVLLGLAAFTACWFAGMELAGIQDVLLHIAPLALVAVPILAGRYPGERFLTAALARKRGHPSAGSPARPSSPRHFRVLPRGGRLIASSLAGRAPPFTGQCQP